MAGGGDSAFAHPASFLQRFNTLAVVPAKRSASRDP